MGTWYEGIMYYKLVLCNKNVGMCEFLAHTPNLF